MPAVRCLTERGVYFDELREHGRGRQDPQRLVDFSYRPLAVALLYRGVERDADLPAQEIESRRDDEPEGVVSDASR